MIPSAANPLLEAAVHYHGLGRPVIPVQADKTPACREWGRWRFEAQPEQEVRALFERPAHGLAVLTWPASDLLVLDFDGPHAERAWKEKTGIDLPATGRHRTRSGGLHLLFRIPDNTPRPGRQAVEAGLRRKVRLVSDPACGCEKSCGVDLLLNGYFIVPPTPGYAEDPDAPSDPGNLAIMPGEVLALARAAERENGDAPGRVDVPGAPIPHGQRNAVLTSLAGSMRRRGMSEAAILAALLEENAQRCTPPLPEQEVRNIARSVGKYQPAAGTSQAADGQPAEEVPTPGVVRQGDDFTFTWTPLAVEVSVTRLRDSGEGIHGEVSVTHGDRPLHWGRLALASTSARETLVKKLTSAGPKVPWRALLEEVCRGTAARLREGTATVHLIPGRAATEHPLVDRLLLENATTVIFGDGGTGKSLLALALAVAVATGKPLPAGLTPRRTGPVLYLDWEDYEGGQQERLAGLLAGLGIQEEVPIFYRRMVAALADDTPRLRAEVARVGAILVIVDSAGPASGAEPEGADAAVRTLNAVRGFGPAALVLAHVNKVMADQRGAARPFGSVYMMNMPRNVWEVRRAEEDQGDDLVLGAYHRKTNRGRLLPPFGLRFEFEGDALIRVRTADLGDDPGLRARAGTGYSILALLRSGARTTSELEEETGAGEKATKQALYRLKKAGRVVQVEAPAPGRQARWGLKA